MSNCIEAFPSTYIHLRAKSRTPLFSDPKLTYFMPGNWVYIAKSGTLYKIGSTSYSVDRRMRNLQRQFPDRRIEQVCYALAKENRYNTERWFHRQMKEFSIGREWFDVSTQEAKDLLANLIVHDSAERRGSKFFRVRLLTDTED